MNEEKSRKGDQKQKETIYTVAVLIYADDKNVYEMKLPLPVQAQMRSCFRNVFVTWSPLKNIQIID